MNEIEVRSGQQDGLLGLRLDLVGAQGLPGRALGPPKGGATVPSKGSIKEDIRPYKGCTYCRLYFGSVLELCL